MKNFLALVFLVLGTSNLQSQIPACSWTINWELDCGTPRNLNIGFICKPSNTIICQNVWGTTSCQGCWGQPCTVWTYASPPFCYFNTGFVGSPGCTTRGPLVLCINGVCYKDGDMYCCNPPDMSQQYPFCSSCGCVMIHIDEPNEIINAEDPRPFGNFCPPSN